MTTPGPWLDLLDQQRRYSDLDHAREELMTASMLTGEEVSILGCKVRIRLEWTDRPPMSDDQLRAYGESIKASALRELERLGSL